MKYLLIEDNKEFAEALCKHLLKNVEVAEIDKTCNDKTLKFSNGEDCIALDFSKHTTREIADAVIETHDPAKNKKLILFINVNLHSGKDSRQQQKGIELLIWLRIKGVMNHCVLYSFEDLHTILNREPKHLIATSQGTTFVLLPNNFSKLKYELLKGDTAKKDNLTETIKVSFENTGLQHKLANIYGLWFMFNLHNNYFKDERLDVNIFGKEFIESFNPLQLHIANFLVCGKNTNTSTNQLLKKVTELKTFIQTKNPKILYIDDKAEIGWADFLKKIIYGNGNSDNFQYLVPEKVSFDKQAEFEIFFEKVKLRILNNKNFIDCLLLDLRLADELGDIDDLDNLSGIKLLKRIHQSFPSLPVVMFTASNKAKSVKKIITCGADGLWTKPGLDDLKDNEYYLESYRELLSFLVSSLQKYTSQTEKHIVNAQFQTELIPEATDYPQELKDVNIILTDTTFWCYTKADLVNNHKSARRLLNLSNGFPRKRFIVINDVTNELFNHTQNKNNIALQISSQYGLETIQKYKETITNNQNWIGSGFQDVENAIKENISYLKESTKGGGFHIVSNVKKIHSYHMDESEATTELSKRKNDGYKPLHADDTFQLLIPYFMQTHTIQYQDKNGTMATKTINSQNVLFITDDFNSNVPNIIRTIGLKFGNNNWTIPKGFKKEEEILKINGNGKHCLILHSKVLHKICFPKNGISVNTIELPNTP